MVDGREDYCVGWFSVGFRREVVPHRPTPGTCGASCRGRVPEGHGLISCRRRHVRDLRRRHEACSGSGMKEYAQGIQSSELSLVDVPRTSGTPQVTDAAQPIVIDYGRIAPAPRVDPFLVKARTE